MADKIRNFYQSSPNSGMHYYLHHTAGSLAIDRRDKVFAILGLATLGQSSFIPDYTKALSSYLATLYNAEEMRTWEEGLDEIESFNWSTEIDNIQWEQDNGSEGLRKKNTATLQSTVPPEVE
ncbi:uncharacterized protein BDZ99DRAFT_526722 [Mytilinidion resinicola]|uniref:Uncharacterized protein n=1 Tax=Mytilinidion resinicola TaxID=574789 RepID=A0A6A6Y4B9_9PEZI|nr:uncharacterized protein BDZ99DRAFT_526722 [Mytilinidion resinicola]KAF2803368.1 hypothetical protein BDZ99DRAFT_526722 [Mytilinidion resinicola]